MAEETQEVAEKTTEGVVNAEPSGKTKQQKDQKKAPNKTGSGLYAVVLVRGLMGIRSDIRDALFMLRLRKKHTCVIITGSTINIGMLKKVKDYVAYGPVSQETVDALAKARKSFVKDRQVFALAPPRGGFERGGIKKPFTTGGVLGARKEMDTLIKKMI